MNHPHGKFAQHKEKHPLPLVSGDDPLSHSHADEENREYWLSKVPDKQSKGEAFILPKDDIRFVFDAKGAHSDAADLPNSHDGTRPIPKHFNRRFVHAPRHILEKALGSIDDVSWNDWRWQQRKRFRRIEQLDDVICVTQNERDAFAKSDSMFHMGITPYYASLMNPDDPRCPIRMQSVPISKEIEKAKYDLEDPLPEDEDSPVPGLTHRYPDRVLFLVTNQCSMYCRYCTRRRFSGQIGMGVPKKQLDGAIEYIRNTPQVRDVLISGGDGLLVNDQILEYILKNLRAIPHVEIIRIATTVGVVAVTTKELAYTTAVGAGLRSAVRGLPLKVVIYFNGRPLHVLVARPEIKSLPDLRRKVIGFAGYGDSTEFMLRAILRQAGMELEKDVQAFQVSGSGQRLQALLTGKLDAATVQFVAPDPYYALPVVLASVWGIGHHARFGRDALGGFAPATDRDFAYWAGLPLRDVRTGLRAISSEIKEVRVGGQIMLTLGDGLPRLPRRGQVRLRRGRIHEAQRDFLAAAVRAPHVAAPLLLAASTYFQLGLRDQAANVLDEVAAGLAGRDDVAVRADRNPELSAHLGRSAGSVD